MKIVYVVPGPMEKGEVKRRGQLLKRFNVKFCGTLTIP